PQAGLGGSPMFPYCSKEKAVSEQDAKHPTIETGADSAKLDFSRKIVSDLAPRNLDILSPYIRTIAFESFVIHALLSGIIDHDLQFSYANPGTIFLVEFDDIFCTL
ncbi:MAG: hypothetical protein MR821_11500, partial [Clostridiales bacterium]|nr:hypothetical protein [Clostridiales bacterium]